MTSDTAHKIKRMLYYEATEHETSILFETLAEVYGHEYANKLCSIIAGAFLLVDSKQKSGDKNA